MTAPTNTGTRPARRRSARRFLPPQHGAWAMLLLPYLAGVLAAGFRWVDLPLLGAWLAGYLLSYFALQAVKTRRPRRVRAQLAWYAPITVAFAVPVLVSCPRVLFFAPAYAALLAVNAWYAIRRMIRERSSRAYRRASVAFHALALLVAAVLGPFPAAVFAWLLVRAWLLPGRRLTPKQVGVAEIADSVLVLVAAVV